MARDSCHDRENAGFLQDLEIAPWSDRVHLHVSVEGCRADLNAILAAYQQGHHLYTCGPDRYMSTVLETAERLGWPDESLHREYFSVPDVPEYENHDFSLVLASSGQKIEVSAEVSAADALLAAGFNIDLKCSDGICGVCKCSVQSGEVEHRDFVLSKAQREHSMILCQSRALQPGGEIRIAL